MMKTISSCTYNPYIMGPPVTGTAFYGRQEVLRFVRETLAPPAEYGRLSRQSHGQTAGAGGNQLH